MQDTMTKTDNVESATATPSSNPFRESTIRDPELKSLNRHERRKYVAVKRKKLREIARLLRTGKLRKYT